MPNELEGLLRRFGVKNIEMMSDPKQRSDFLDICYKYDSNPYVCGMGKDNLLAKGDL